MSTIKVEDYSWFELFAENKKGGVDFICRTIAKSEDHAIRKLKPETFTVLGSKMLGNLVFKRYVKKLTARLASDEILSYVDLNNPTHVELLRTTEVIVEGMTKRKQS